MDLMMRMMWQLKSMKNFMIAMDMMMSGAGSKGIHV